MPLTTQYRVLVTDKPSVVSPILTVNVTVVVGTRTTRTHVHRGGHVHFSGTVQPKVANVPVAIQKLNAKKHWVTISGTITRTGGTYWQDRAHQARRELPGLRGRQRRHLRSRRRAQGPHPHNMRPSGLRPGGPTFGGLPGRGAANAAGRLRHPKGPRPERPPRPRAGSA